MISNVLRNEAEIIVSMIGQEDPQMENAAVVTVAVCVEQKKIALQLSIFATDVGSNLVTERLHDEIRCPLFSIQSR